MRIHVRFTFAIGAAALAVSLAACNSTTTPILAAVGGSATSPGSTTTPLVITPSQLQLAPGTSAQLSTNAPTAVQSQLRWSSSQTAVASVSSTGLVTGFGTGSASITVRYASDTTNVASATIIVSMP